MNKKILLIFPLLITLATSCDPDNNTYEVALILSNANAQAVNDHSFNEAAYTAIKDYCEPRDISYNYFVPPSEDEEGYLSTFDEAALKGAKIIICAGYSFTSSIQIAANKYQDISFVLLDDTLENIDNCVSISFNEEESGYLAGYALGMEGLSTVGFVGGGQKDGNGNDIILDPIVRFGLGYVKGISDAWKEKSSYLANDEVIKVYYGYCYTFEANDRLSEILSQWYEVGTEAIFTCGGSITESAIEASEYLNLTKPSVVGVDVDQSYLSNYVLTSAMKNIAQAVLLQLEAFYNNAFEGGRHLTYSVDENAVGLPTNDSSFKFKNFTIQQYEEIYRRLQDDEIDFDINLDLGKTEQGVVQFAYELENVDITWSDIVF